MNNQYMFFIDQNTNLEMVLVTKPDGSTALWTRDEYEEADLLAEIDNWENNDEMVSDDDLRYFSGGYNSVDEC